MNNINLNEITPEQFAELKKRFDAAENDTTPFAVLDEEDGNKLKVIGDVNKTETKKADYTLVFYYPNTEEYKEALKDEEIISETPNYLGVERKYKDAWIPPRRFTEIQNTLIHLYKFFNIVDEAGEIRDLTTDEIAYALDTMNADMVDAMYAVVCEVLRIPKEMASYMLVTPVVGAVLQMANDFPEVINGVDFTTGRLLDES